MQEIEIERRFRVLVDVSGWSERFHTLAAWEIWQGYLTPPEATAEVRIRRLLALQAESLGDFRPAPVLDDLGRETVRQLITVKQDIATSGSGGLSRREAETLVDDRFFQQAWLACEGQRLRKIRVEFGVDLPEGDYRVVVVDSYMDRLEGLTLAEIEFPSWIESSRFSPPDLLGPEVTHDARFRNVNLARAATPPAL